VDGPATDAVIGLPRSVFVDSVGNIFFSDAVLNRVLMIDTLGILREVAGDGFQGLPEMGLTRRGRALIGPLESLSTGTVMSMSQIEETTAFDVWMRRHELSIRLRVRGEPFSTVTAPSRQ
jgi:hypothetical protein